MLSVKKKSSTEKMNQKANSKTNPKMNAKTNTKINEIKIVDIVE